MGLRRRQTTVALLALNALRPRRGYRTALPSFAAGWATGDLAPHLLGATLADVAWHLRARRPGSRDRVGLALGAAAALGLGRLVVLAARSEAVLTDALTDPDAVPDAGPTPLAPVTSAQRRAVRRHLLWPLASPVRGLDVERDIAYSEAGRRGRLDVYRPSPDAAPVRPGQAGAPVLVQVHGGAWITGDKTHQALPLMRHLADRGWVCVALNYRLARRDPFPAQVVDVKRVLAWVQEHIAAYGGDPSFVALTGGSAGGHLVALAALTADDPTWQPGFEDADCSVSAAVPFYGVYDVAGATGSGPALALRDRFWGPTVAHARYADDPALFEAATPLLRVHPDAPPFFLLHGDRDSLVPVAQARAMVARLREVSRRPVLYAEMPGAQHGFDSLTSLRSTQVVRAVEAFLRTTAQAQARAQDQDPRR